MKYIYNWKLFEKLDGESIEYNDLKSGVLEYIEKSVNKTDKESIKKFLESFIRDSESNPIKGLINDSDIYEFYLKYRNNIDQLLSKKDFYKKNPSDMESFGLYDYLIIGTKEAIKEVVKLILQERMS